MDYTVDFDPVTRLSTAPLAKPPELEPINLRTLTPFQRALLVIDGTVTKFIEAYTLEPVEIERLSHEILPLAEANPWLSAPAGARVALRHVHIKGRYSRVLYVYAVSVILMERWPEAARRQLETAGAGIGRVLSASGLETRREVLWYGREHSAELLPQDCGGGEFITRTYRILSSGRPIALITERFPIGSERLPSQY